MDDKQRLEQIKNKQLFEYYRINSDFISLDDVRWLIEQTEKVEQLQKEVEFWKDIAESCECNN